MNTTSAGPAIEAIGLSKQFNTVHAVSDLSFTVPTGSITGFIGPNGSGKTTTLRMLLGLIAPTSGSSTVAGVPFAALPQPARTVGAVLDSLSLHPNRTALGHLLVYSAAIGVTDERARHVLALVGLEQAARQRAGTFSLGMRQRLALATALLGDPRILVLDEPANGLDPEGIAWLRDFLRAFAESGRTVLVSSHILREVEQIVDRLVIVNRGSLVYQGGIEDLRRSHSARVLVAASDPARLALALGAEGLTDAQVLPDGRLAVRGAAEQTVAGIAAAADVKIFGSTIEQVDLEQVFLSMTAGQYAAQHYGPPLSQQYGTDPFGGPR
ncbi:ATP-binding cassette domain-containing protein [Rhodococcus spelaei]|uniref:ATP-binding cassette domain-containing protein n=1 Tax=Rhodococcus spelaei TaxID=2546320 RepID=A0A541AZR7_9NOCA|nr:ATP-binding cassette domain-containing protein [Rhodococcus spelaei]TQF65568.1 ATP-binding cassette domain-containing protein [Rhodococcus spelaei]